MRKISRLLGISSVETAQSFLREDRNTLRSEARLLEGRLAEANLDELKTRLESASRLPASGRRAGESYRGVRAGRGGSQGGRRGPPRARRDVPRTLAPHVRPARDRGGPAPCRRPGCGCREGSGRPGRQQRRKSDACGPRPPGCLRWRRTSKARRGPAAVGAASARSRKDYLEAQRSISDIEGEVSTIWRRWTGTGTRSCQAWSIPSIWTEKTFSRGPRCAGRATGELERGGPPRGAAEAPEDHEAYRVSAKVLREADGSYLAAREEAAGLAEDLEDLSGGEDLELAERELREEEDKLRELAAHHRGRANADEREAGNVDKAARPSTAAQRSTVPPATGSSRAGAGGDLRHPEEAGGRDPTPRRPRDRRGRKLAGSAEMTGEKLESLDQLGRWRELRKARPRTASPPVWRHSRKPGPTGGARGPHHDTETPGDADSKRPAPARPPEGLRDARPHVKSLATEHSKQAQRVEKLAKELEGLSTVSYDAEAHRKKREEARLERALGRIEELERRLATRPEVERALQAARGGRGGGDCGGEVAA